MSQASSPFASPLKQSQRQIPKEVPVDNDELNVPDFAPLPSYPGDARLWFEEFAIWRPPTMFDMDVARPQRMHDGPVSETPISISYAIFAKCFNKHQDDSVPFPTLSNWPTPMEANPPLSFPAILRNAGITGRYAHLQANPQPQTAPTAARKLKREHEGKRWIRRKDNARFTGNPHIVAATKRDYSIPTPQTRPTFPEPLPAYLPRTTKVPTTTIPECDINSANAGRFSLSLKGMRKALRKCGFRAELLVRDIEYEIVEWLQRGGIVLNPDSRETEDLTAPGVPIGDTGTIFEVSRTPLQLIWYTDDDSFARYVVHCCARYHEIVSFSKELSGRRLTYLLRPNVNRPDHHAPNGLDTPPVTDIDYSSHPDTESDRDGLETDSDIEQPSAEQSGASHLPAISEDDVISSSESHPARLDEEAWSLVDDTDIEGDELASDAELVVGLEAVSIGLGHEDLDATPRANVYLRQKATRRRLVWPQDRSSSSPSRSPVRRPFHRGPLRYDQHHLANLPPHQHCSFYDYLFS
ncbi:hypothetical protein C0991_004603 [Blastosporella zonata]|nr:hypothetical protein C0991_004603 [Blastosporella zonata]